LVTKIGKKCISINLMNDMQINLQHLQFFYSKQSLLQVFIYRQVYSKISEYV